MCKKVGLFFLTASVDSQFSITISIYFSSALGNQSPRKARADATIQTAPLSFLSSHRQ